MNSTTDSLVARRGLMLVLSSPSGTGKTTLAGYILDNDRDISLSVSVTTRSPRPGEIDGRDYHFISSEVFGKMEREGKLLEAATVFGNKYGTVEATVSKLLEESRDVLFDVDWQGAQKLKRKVGEDLVTIFILPPSGMVLSDRLTGRAQDSADVVSSRMNAAASEISHWSDYDYVIINDDIEKAGEQLLAILKAERLRRSRQTGLRAFVKNILSDL